MQSVVYKEGNDTFCLISRNGFNTQTETMTIQLLAIISSKNEKHYLSTNTETFSFFKGPIAFEVFDDVINFEVTKNKTYLNVTIPSVSNRNYLMNSKAQSPVTHSIFGIGGCSFSQNTKPYCLNLTLKPDIIPAVYEFSIQITHAITSKTFNISVNPVIYYDQIPQIERVVPHFSSFMDTYKKKIDYKTRLLKKHNSKQFKYYCKVIYPGLEYFLNATLPNPNDIGCNIGNEFKHENMSLEIYFETFESKSKMLLSNLVTIQHHKYLTLDKNVGFSEGFTINLRFPISSVAFNYNMKYELGGSYYSLQNCSVSTVDMNCTLPKTHFDVNPTYLQIELFANEVQFFSLLPIIQINSKRN